MSNDREFEAIENEIESEYLDELEECDEKRINLIRRGIIDSDGEPYNEEY